ncbi:MAG: hypothetical protein ABEJ25_01480 [Candidatus Bipolaricaulia bacterium]
MSSNTNYLFYQLDPEKKNPRKIVPSIEDELSVKKQSKKGLGS